MSIKTKRIIALSICLLLLTAAIFQNIRNNSKAGNTDKDNNKDGLIVNDGDDNDDETGGEILDAEEFFAGARLDRESKRSLTEAECTAVIGDQDATDEEKAAAQELQLALEMMVELEGEMETAIKSRGYEDVFVELDENGYVNVTVMAEELTEQEVMALADVVVSAANISLDQLAIKSII